MRVFSFLQFDFLEFLSLRCWQQMSFMSFVTWTSLIPVFTLATIATSCGSCLAFAVAAQSRESLKSTILVNHVKAALVFLYLVLPSCIMLQIRGLLCDVLDEAKGNILMEIGPRGDFLRADTSIDCKSSQYREFFGVNLMVRSQYLLNSCIKIKPLQNDLFIAHPLFPHALQPSSSW